MKTRSTNQTGSALQIGGDKLWVSQFSQLIGSICYSGAMWLLALLMIRETGIEEYGRYAAALAVSAPIFMCANARGRLLVSSAGELPAPVAAYILYRVGASIVAGIICLVLAAWGMKNEIILVLAVVMFKGFEAVSDMLLAILQRNGRAELVGVSQSLKAMLFLILLSLGWRFGLEMAAAFVGLLAAGLASWVAFDVFLVVRSWPKTAKLEGFPELRSLGLVLVHLKPMMAIALLASLFSMLPRVFLDIFHGYAEVGNYSALMLFNSAAMIVVAALGQPYLRGIGAANAKGDLPAIRHYLLQMTVVAVFVSAVFALLLGSLGGPIFALVLDSAMPVPGQSVGLIVAVIFLNSLCLMQWYVMAALGIRRAQVWLTVGALGTMISVCLILVPSLAVSGALFADAIALGTQMIIAATIIVYTLHRTTPKSVKT